jgi:hypothetical protein
VATEGLVVERIKVAETQNALATNAITTLSKDFSDVPTLAACKKIIVEMQKTDPTFNAPVDDSAKYLKYFTDYIAELKELIAKPLTAITKAVDVNTHDLTHASEKPLVKILSDYQTALYYIIYLYKNNFADTEIKEAKTFNKLSSLS